MCFKFKLLTSGSFYVKFLFYEHHPLLNYFDFLTHDINGIRSVSIHLTVNIFTQCPETTCTLYALHACVRTFWKWKSWVFGGDRDVVITETWVLIVITLTKSWDLTICLSCTLIWPDLFLTHFGSMTSEWPGIWDEQILNCRLRCLCPLGTLTSCSEDTTLVW